MIDFALHHLDLCRYLCGEFKTLSIQHNQTDDRVAIAGAATFENGAVESLQLNSQRIWWRNYDRIEITKAIREAREPVANMADCVNTIRVAEAVYLAVRDGHQGEIDLS